MKSFSAINACCFSPEPELSGINPLPSRCRELVHDADSSVEVVAITGVGSIHPVGFSSTIINGFQVLVNMVSYFLYLMKIDINLNLVFLLQNALLKFAVATETLQRFPRV